MGGSGVRRRLFCDGRNNGSCVSDGNDSGEREHVCWCREGKTVARVIILSHEGGRSQGLDGESGLSSCLSGDAENPGPIPSGGFISQ